MTMDNVHSIDARRWDASNLARECRPVDALREAIRRIETGEWKADHIIVCSAGREDDGDWTDVLVAGSFGALSTIGMLRSIEADFIAGNG
jgi:hypothetical protein